MMDWSFSAIIERVLEKALANSAVDLQPQKEAFALTQSALRENQAQIEKMFTLMNSGQSNSTLFTMLNERATQLQAERERLQREASELAEVLAPVDAKVDANAFPQRMVTFVEIMEEARPEKLQRLLRLLVRRVEWMPGGAHRVEYYCEPALLAAQNAKTSSEDSQNWLYTDRRLDCLQGCNVEPLWFEFLYLKFDLQEEQSLLLSGEEARGASGNIHFLSDRV